MLRTNRLPGIMVTFPEQSATILEYVLLFVGIGYLVWILLSPAGRTLRLRAPALVPWDLPAANFLLLIWLVVTMIALGLVLVPAAFGPALRSRPEGATLELVVTGSMLQVGAIAAWLVVRVLHRQWLRGSYDPGLRPSPAASLRGGFLTFLAVVPIVTAVSLLWTLLLDLLGLPTAQQELVDFFTQARSPVVLGTLTALALAVAPIGEEMIFRAGLFRYLRTRLPRWLAFTISAGLFASMHFNWPSFLPLFVLGVVFAIAYERTGRIAVPILAHALFNLNTLLVVLSHAPV